MKAIMSEIITATVPSPIGNLGITINTHQNKLSSLKFLGHHTLIPSTITSAWNKKLLNNIIIELQNYFQNPKFVYSLPLEIKGTPFQHKVWEALCKIPVGKTVSYGELATKLQTGPRAIGNACRANPIALIIPCHRITAKNHLGGFAGNTSGQIFEIKKWLLQHEA